MYFIGELKLGPYLTFTLFFLSDKKISFANDVEKKNKDIKKIKVAKLLSLIIFYIV